MANRTESDPLAWLEPALAQWEAAGLRRRLSIRETPQSGHTTAGLNFGSNDYLGLASDPRLAAAAADVWREGYGGAGASPLVTGRSRWHAALEQRLAEFEHGEAALLFPTGFAANSGIIPALVGPEDAVFSDAKNHASIIDGCRLSRAEIHIYRHADADHLAEQIVGNSARRKLIVTDTLFSMDGDLAPLGPLVELAERHAAMLMVDEAHATGVLGPNGRGACEQFGVADRVPIRVGTLSKALGCLGGFVVGSRQLIDWLANRARSYVFSTAPPDPLCAAAIAAVELIVSEPERRRQLLTRAEDLRNQLLAAGWRVPSGCGPIVPVILGTPAEAVDASRFLADHGMFVPAIRPPTVPDGESLLRVSLTAAHASEDIERLLDGLQQWRKRR